MNSEIIKSMIVGTICIIITIISIAAYTEYRARESIKDIKEAVNDMNAEMERKSQEQKARLQAEQIRLEREAQARQAEQDRIENEQREAALMQQKAEIAQHQAETDKKAQFEAEFKPRAECNDPNLDWEKTIQCKNERISARETFYRTH